MTARKLLIIIGLSLNIIIIYAQPNGQNLSCGSPDNFSLGNNGYVGDNPTTSSGSCGQCCYSGSDLDGDGDQEVSFSVENSVWYKYCNPTGSTITIDITVDEVFDNCNVQGAVFVGPSGSIDVDCSNPGFQEYGSNPGGNGDGFTFTVTLDAGECALVMIDGYGGATCSDLTIEVPCCTAPTTVSAGPDQTICEGDDVPLDGSISGGLVESGGPTYSWSPITGLSCSDCEDPTASPPSTTTYTLTACNSSDGTACCLNDAATVTVEPAFTPDAGSDITSCAPSTFTIGGSPTGPAGSTYSWAVSGPNNGNIAITSGATSANPTVTISAGASGSETYEVTVTNGSCVFTDQITVTVGSLTVDAGSAGSICVGESIVVGGSPTAPAGSSYNWTCTSNCTGITITSSGDANPSISADPTASGIATFQVEATLASCTNTDVVNVTVNPLPTTPTASASPSTVCAGITSTLTASGGAGSGTYTWWNASTGGTQLASGNTYDVNPLSTTTYYIQSTDGTTGCESARSAVTVTTTVAPVADAGPDSNTCDGSTYTLDGAVANPQACGTQTWSVISGSGTFSPNANALNAVFTPTTTGNIELALTPCTSGGCPVVPDTFVLAVTDTPSVVASTTDDTLCAGEADITTLGATTTGGTPTPTVETNTFSTSGGPYSIPNNDCSTGVTIPITVSGVSDPVLGSTTVSICMNIDLNSVGNIKVELCAPGGSPCITLQPDGSTLSGNDMIGTCYTDASGTDIASGSSPYSGSFNPYGSVNMSDLGGVSTNGTWTLNVYDCAGGPSGEVDDWSITFETPLPVTPYTYSWTSTTGIGDTTSDNTTLSASAFGVSTETKTVVATDANGCTSTDAVTVEMIDCNVMELEKPVKIMALKVIEFNGYHELSWKAREDKFVDFYQIEKSSNGIDFEHLSVVNSLQKEKEHEYEYINPYPNPETGYYRVIAIDHDKNKFPSNVVKVEYLEKSGLSVYPAITQGPFTVIFNTEEVEDILYEIKNSIGQKIHSETIISKKGTNQLDLTLDGLPSSSYFVYFHFSNKVYRYKLIKH